jgi:hypothetical protein
MKRQPLFCVGLVLAGLCWALARSGAPCAQETEKTAVQKASTEDPAAQEAPTEKEMQTSVPALMALHEEVVYPLWHTAYPSKDYIMIKQLLPQADSLVARLDEAELPGILRDKAGEWDIGLAELNAALENLHASADADNEDAMLLQTELFHAAFERLVRTIRPVAPELDAFHKEMYKLYHYHTPEYDLARMREAVAAMQEKIPPLKEAKLPKRVADRKGAFDEAVVELEAAVAELAETIRTDDKDAILKAVEKAHSAYQKTEEVFN